MKHHTIVLLLLLSALASTAKQIEKKGYIITKSGDTLHGTLHVETTKKGDIIGEKTYQIVIFSNDSISKSTFLPGDIKGYGGYILNDTSQLHFIAFKEVEMHGGLAKKKGPAFLLRQTQGQVELLYLYHAIDNIQYPQKLVDIYLRQSSKEDLRPQLIEFINSQSPLRYRKTEIMPFLNGWPAEEAAKFPDELKYFDLKKMITDYNAWRSEGVLSEVEKQAKTPGWIINNNGDTIKGSILIRKMVSGSVMYEDLFKAVNFADEKGHETTYQPGQIKGFSFEMPGTDRYRTTYVSFLDVEAHGLMGMKKENAFLIKNSNGPVELYHMLTTQKVGGSKVSELYLKGEASNNKLQLIHTEGDTFSEKYRRSDIAVFLRNWPASELRKYKDILDPGEVMDIVHDYNEWAMKNN